MRLTGLLALCIFIFSCQKEASLDNKQIIASTFDSLVGRWKYKYDYRLETTQADSTIILNTYYGGRYDPYSYLEIKADSTFKWWRSESKSLPMYGGGEGGHVIPNESLRRILWNIEFHSMDNFVTNIPYSTPISGPNFRIKHLSSDSLVLFFRVSSANPGNYWWWHDVYTR
jgi:hypothetical protein